MNSDRFSWRYFRREEDEVTLPYLLAVLRLSKFWGIRKGIKHAIRALNHRSDFQPFLKMNYALKYDIEEWIEPAFRQIVNHSRIHYRRAKIDTMGVDTFRLIMRTRIDTIQYRLSMAYTVPDMVQSKECMDSYRCQQDWEFL